MTSFSAHARPSSPGPQPVSYRFLCAVCGRDRAVVGRKRLPSASRAHRYQCAACFAAAKQVKEKS